MDVVEIDPLVHQMAVNHFGLHLPESSTTINILSGSSYVSRIAQMNRDINHTLQKWSHVIHDCFSAGNVPMEMYTKGFWEDLSELVEVDGIIAVVSEHFASPGGC